MYVLIKTIKDDIELIAVSTDKELLLRKMRKMARAYVKEYYIDGQQDDSFSIQKGRRLLAQLNTHNTDCWWDEDDDYPYTLEVFSAPLIFPKRKKKIHTVKMAFGEEICDKLANAESAEEMKAVIEEYKDTDMLVVRTFNTAAEKAAYLRGVCDDSGSAERVDIAFEYPRIARLIPDKDNQED